jgi:hypothetical protein
MLKLALYKGPPKNDLLHTVGHNLTRLWTWSKYSHSEIVIGDYCYSSSSRDGGVRKKQIDLNSGRWDLVNITSNPYVISQALLWFKNHEGDPYDYRNIVRFVLPFIGHNRKHWVCYEACGAMLGIDKPHKLDADKLLYEALRLHKIGARGESP